MRLTTIVLGACALFTLSFVQAQEAAATGPPEADEEAISAEALKKKVVYPPLSELESRVHFFNAFVADENYLQEVEKEVAEPAAAEKVKKEKENAAVEKKKQEEDAEKKKAQKAFKVSSAQKKAKAAKKGESGQDNKKKTASGHHHHKTAQEHSEQHKQYQQKGHRQQHIHHHANKLDHSHHHQGVDKLDYSHHQHHEFNAAAAKKKSPQAKQHHHQDVDKLDHSHHQHREFNAAAAKEKSPHAKQHHYHMKAQNNKSTKTKNYHHDCIAYETIKGVRVCNPIPKVDAFPDPVSIPNVAADANQFPNPSGELPITGGLISPIESDYPGVDDDLPSTFPKHSGLESTANPNESSPGSIIDENDGESPGLDNDAVPDATVAQPAAAPIAEPVLVAPPRPTPQSPSSPFNDDNANEGVNPPSSSSAKPEPNIDEDDSSDQNAVPKSSSQQQQRQQQHPAQPAIAHTPASVPVTASVPAPIKPDENDFEEEIDASPVDNKVVAPAGAQRKSAQTIAEEAEEYWGDADYEEEEEDEDYDDEDYDDEDDVAVGRLPEQNLQFLRHG